MEQSSEQKMVLNIYAALTVSLLLSFLPMAGAAILSTVMFTGVLIAAYSMRRKADHDSLMADHMTFIIRTMWVAALFGFITTSIAGAYVLSVYDPSVILDCTGGVNSTDMAALNAALKPCMDKFVEANMSYFIKGTVMAAAPLVIYIGYRLAKGLSRAVKGHRVGDNKSWF